VSATAAFRDLWDRASADYLRLSDRIAFYRETSAVLAAMIPAGIARLMDFGCGDGRLARTYLASTPPALRARTIYLVDGAPDMLARTTDIVAGDIVAGDIAAGNLPAGVEVVRLVDDETLAGFPASALGTIDAIACNAVLANLRGDDLRPALGSFLARARRVLAPGGRIVANMADQDFDFGDGRPSQFVFQADALWPRRREPADRFRWTREGLAADAERAGFRLSCEVRSFQVTWQDFVTFYRIPFMGQDRFPGGPAERQARLDRQPPVFDRLEYRWAFLTFTLREDG